MGHGSWSRKARCCASSCAWVQSAVLPPVSYCRPPGSPPSRRDCRLARWRHRRQPVASRAAPPRPGRRHNNRPGRRQGRSLGAGPPRRVQGRRQGPGRLNECPSKAELHDVSAVRLYGVIGYGQPDHHPSQAERYLHPLAVRSLTHVSLQPRVGGIRKPGARCDRPGLPSWQGAQASSITTRRCCRAWRWSRGTPDGRCRPASARFRVHAGQVHDHAGVRPNR